MLPKDFWGRVWFLLQQYSGSYLKGAGQTMLIALVGTLAGCIIGFVVGVIQTIPKDRKEQPVRWLLTSILQFAMNAYVEVFRGTPMMAQAMFIFYGLAMVWNIHLPTLAAALLIVSINTGAYMAETVRGGILSVDPGQTEGAKSIGMNHVQTMTSVILPQALRNIMPQIGNNLIINIKDTCVLSVISVVELFFVNKSVSGAYYTYFEAATITMAIYFTLTFLCSRLLRLAEQWMDGPDHYDLATTDTLAYTSGMNSLPDRVVERRQAEQNLDIREGR